MSIKVTRRTNIRDSSGNVIGVSRQYSTAKDSFGFKAKQFGRQAAAKSYEYAKRGAKFGVHEGETAAKNFADAAPSAGLKVVGRALGGIRPTVRLGNTPGVKISDQLLNSTRGLRVEFNTRASDD